jgi:deazaflavin-dependent oxidoreductase (nitroreductase family)
MLNFPSEAEMGVSNFNWQRMKIVQKVHRVLYALGLGPLIGRIILLLTTVGRKTGLKRVTPLQYEEIDGKYYLGAARGTQADWVRNIQSNPDVDVRVKSLNFHGHAVVVTEPSRIADFIEVRLQRHPLMIGAIMQRAHGLPKHPSREQLEKLAENEALVIITPMPFSEN